MQGAQCAPYGVVRQVWTRTLPGRLMATGAPVEPHQDVSPACVGSGPGDQARWSPDVS